MGHHQLREHALLRERTNAKWIKVLLLATRSPLESGVPGICAGLEPTVFMVPSLRVPKEPPRARAHTPTHTHTHTHAAPALAVCKERTPRT